MGKKRLLVVGGTGVLSTAVVIEALRQGLDVTIINRGNRPNRIPPGAHLIKTDVRDKNRVISLLGETRFDAIIDFICFNKNQIEYSIDLFKHYVDQYIFISSACVYDTSIPGIKSEDSPKVLKDWNYSVEKWECELCLRKKSEEDSVPFTIVRPCITYDNTRIPYGIMPPYGYHWTFISRILNNKPIITWDGGKSRWNMMRVEDFAVGVCSVIGNEAALGQAYNISGDESYSWEDVLVVLEKLLHKKITRFDIPSSDYRNLFSDNYGRISGRALDLIVSNAKIKKLCPEFKTRIGLYDGISMTLAAYKAQNYQKGIDWRYDATTDLIIRQWCKIKGIELEKSKTSFIDYLGKASLNDKIEYWMWFNNMGGFLKIAKRITKKLSRII